MSGIEDALREAVRRNTVRQHYAGYIRRHELLLLPGDPTGGKWRLHELRSSTMLYPVERRDPVFSLLFAGSYLFSTGTFTLFGSAFLASAAGAIASTAVSIGLQYLLMPKPPKPEEQRAPLTQSVPPRFFGVGKTRVAGAYWLWEAVGEDMISVQAIAGHPINAITRYWLHDEEVTLDGNNVEELPNKHYEPLGRVKIYQRIGAIPETAIAEIVAIVADADIWGPDHRGDGQAYLGLVANATKRDRMPSIYPYGRPNLTVEAEFAKVWDPRDGAQDPADPTTWVYSNNAALCLLWHECFNPFGSRRDYVTAILPVQDMWETAADVCDELVDKAGGGTEKRYECNGVDTTENDPKAMTNAILASMDGWICGRGDGALLVAAGAYNPDYVATLTDADIVGHAIQYDVLFEEEINRVVPRFVYPATDYTTSVTDYFEDAAAQVVAGRILSQEADYRFVHQWRQARRLGKREWTRIQAKKRGTLDVLLSGINAAYAPWILLDTPNRIPSLNGKTIANRRSVLALTRGGFQINWIAMPDDPSDIDDWTPASDEGAAPPIPIGPDTEETPEADIDTVVAINNGTSVYVRVIIIDPNRDDLTPVVRYRVADTGGGTPGAWVEQQFPEVTPAGGLITLNTNPVPTDEDIEVQVAFINASGSYGDWAPEPPELISSIVTFASLDFSRPLNSQYLALLLDD